jgi:uncharacterized protein with HEPN domain
MTSLRLSNYILHMQEACSDVVNYMEGLDKESFMSDKRTQQAVIMNLVILGEAATKIMEHYPVFVEDHPHIAWKNMKGMRNRVAHGYFDINLDVVWDTATSAIPTLNTDLINLNLGCDS